MNQEMPPIQQLNEAINQEMKKRHAREEKTPQLRIPEGATIGQMSSALRLFFPNLNRNQRRALVKDAQKRGKGYTKSRKVKR